jgi:HK97 family phage portal protein
LANWIQKLFNNTKDIQLGTVARVTQAYTTNTNNVTAYVNEGYAGSAAVYAIINLIARKFASIPFYVYDVKDVKAFTKYKQASSALLRSASKESIHDLQILKNKALDLYTDSDRISMLLQRPNQYQGIYDLIEQYMGWKQIAGMTCMWAQPFGLSKKEPVELHVLPAGQVQIKGDSRDINKVEEYSLSSYPEKKFSGDEVMRWIYWSPYWDAFTRTHLYGLSPIKAAAYNVDAYNNADKATNSMFENKGAEGFLFGKNMSIPPDKVDALQKTLDDRYNGFMNRGKVIAFGSEVGYAQVGMSATDLQLLEAKQYSFETLCNVFGVPKEAFADDKGSTYNNKGGAMTQMVTNKIIPEWCSFRDQLNPFLLPKFDAVGKKFIDFDVSELPELQKDISALATALNTAWWLTGNEKRTVMEYEERPEPNMDQIIMPGNMMIDTISLEPEPEGDEGDYKG